MEIEKVPAFIADLAKASERAGERLLGPLLWGERGVGKSEAVYQGAALAGLPVVELRIGQMEPGEFLGSMFIQDGRTHYAAPDWWPTERSLVFLDEPNRSHRDTRNAVFQLVLDHRIGPHRLPAGSIVVGAANPPTADYGDVEAIEDAAFLSRWIHLAVTGTVDGWAAYEGQRPGADWLLAAVVRQPDLLGKSAAYLPERGASARSLSVARRLLPHLPERWHLEVLTGLVGVSAAAALIQAREAHEQPVTWSEVLAGGTEERVKHYAAEGRLDLLRPAYEGLFAWLKQAPPGQADQRCERALAWFAELPLDLRAQAIKRFALHLQDDGEAMKAFALNQTRWKGKVDGMKEEIAHAGGFQLQGAK